MKRNPNCSLIAGLGLAALLATPRGDDSYVIEFGDDAYDFGGDFIPDVARPSRVKRPEARPAPDISPLTGKQLLAQPTSNRRAALLEKAMRRAARQSGAVVNTAQPGMSAPCANAQKPLPTKEGEGL